MQRQTGKGQQRVDAKTASTPKESRMTAKQRLGLGLAPLFLRLVLATVFLWAGSAKLFVTDTYSPEQAAALTNLGIFSPPDGSSEPPEAPTDPPAEDELPSDLEIENPALPAGTGATSARSTGAIVLLAQTEAVPPRYTAMDFPDGVKAKRLHSLALLLDARTNPTDGTTPLWPQALGGGTMLKIMPWFVAIAEFTGGLLVLIGLLTRLAALGLTVTMLVAMLLTSVGPAAVSGSGFLGFLPDPQFADANAWVSAWQPMLLQLTSGVIAFALVLTGAGWLSFDQRLAGRKPGGSDGDDS